MSEVTQVLNKLAEIENGFKAKSESIIAEVLAQKGFATQEQYEAIETARKEEADQLKEIIKTQGEAIKQVIESNYATSKHKVTTLTDLLEKARPEIERIKSNQTGQLEYMVNVDKNGELIAIPLKDANKAVSIHSTIDMNTAGGLLASVVNGMSAAATMRAGADANLVNPFINWNYIFDLVNLTNASWDNSFIRYWEELPMEGGATIVAENAIKPQVQFRWELKSAEYKKEAAYSKITDEFEADFGKLTQEVRNRLIREVDNKVNAWVVNDLTTNAVAFAATAAWTGANGVVDPNEYDAIMAMASQVESATFENNANVAVMNTSKYWRINANKDAENRYLYAPRVVEQIRMIRNPAIGLDDIIVGDLKQYNLTFRGGIIVKIGYTGDDLIHNRYSIVVERYFFGYIPTTRKAAIVKGTTFSAVKTAITKTP